MNKGSTFLAVLNLLLIIPMRLFTRENALALLLAILTLLLIIVSSDAAPQWIYQGF